MKRRPFFRPPLDKLPMWAELVLMLSPIWIGLGILVIAAALA